MRVFSTGLPAVALALLGSVASAQRNATLLSVFAPSGEAFNDVWGYTAPNGKEYAILGSLTGAYVVDCTDPANPVQRAYIPASASGWGSSTWRDMRTYGSYLYIVTESGGGMQIVDLTNPDQPQLVKTWGQTAWSNAHNVALDTGTGTLYACGTNRGTVVVDLTDPINPTEVTTFSRFYVHDLHIQDGWAHLAEIRNDRYEILDVTALPTMTSVGTLSVGDCHNAWPTRDNNYAVVTSETNGGDMTIVDISNKRLPTAIASYRTGSSTTSVHNAYVRDRVAHVAYYTEGYRAVDISDPRNPVEVSFFDTSTSTSTFGGDWGCYPFQPSGVIYASDRDRGLHVIGTPATSANYGNGTAGASGVPSLRPFGAAFKGNGNYAVQGFDAAPNASATFVLGAAAGSVVVAGATILIDIAQPFVLLGGTTDAGGEVKIPLPIPAVVASGRVYGQLLVLDAGAPGGIAASPGLEIDVF